MKFKFITILVALSIIFGCTTVANAGAIAGASAQLLESYRLAKDDPWSDPIIFHTIANVNVRTEQNTDSDIVNVLSEYTNVSVRVRDSSNWGMTEDGYYICLDYLKKGEIEYKIYNLYSTFKSFTDWRLVTATDTPQYRLFRNESYSGDYGIRMVDGRYCVALGSRFGCEIGQKFDIILENGEVIPCVMSDQKSDDDTDGTYTLDNGCATEFYVDTDILYHPAKFAGDLSKIPGWNSPVVKIKVYDRFVW